MPKNKVKFGLRRCHYAIATMADDQTVTFDKPVPIPGAVSLTLDPEGDNDPFYADDSVYFLVSTNTGYSGDLEVALIPESFMKDVLKETEDANGVVIENKDAEPAHFALLFEFTGDQKQIRHCMYYCSASRPSMEGQTKEGSTDVKTEKISITCTPLPSGIIKAKTGSNTTDAAYQGWYDKVYEPTEKAIDAAASGSSTSTSGSSKT